MNSTLLRSLPLAFCVFLPSCEGLDPSLLAGLADGGGGGNYPPPQYDSRYDGQEYYRDRQVPDRYSSDDRRYTYDDRRDERYSPPPTGRPDERDRSSNSRENDYFGGPKEWYKSGYALGQKDRSNRHTSSYRRHNTQYDKKTESQFAAGYQDGYGR